MRVEYSKRAFADLRQIAAYYTQSGNSAVAARISGRIEELVVRIARAPLSGRPVIQRPGVRVALLRSYPYKIFYRVTRDTIRIVHIGHTSRRPYD